MRVESDIAIPSGRFSRGAPNKYPFGKMDVGDSFVVMKGDETKIRNASQQYGKRYSMKFSVRKHKQDYRCWRIS